ncbi:hypothetical protein B0H19DRAFT_1065216 [Mycena capillaripes]|nr:hypothetical protein B0H19DRAFT_1065216 [Mycena capillaripes]
MPEEGESHRELLGHISKTEVRATGKPETGRCREPYTRRSTGRPEGWAGPARNLWKARLQRKSAVVRPAGPDLGPRKRPEAKEEGSRSREEVDVLRACRSVWREPIWQWAMSRGWKVIRRTYGEEWRCTGCWGRARGRGAGVLQGSRDISHKPIQQ